MRDIEIIDYQPGHQQYFERLNRAWIEKYFEMEKGDIETLLYPEENILQKGGAILMAACDGIIAGTVALKKVNSTAYELTKMAVDEHFRRKGIAERLCYASFRKAKELGAETILLFSNSILFAAIAMYEKIGFHHLPLEDSAYQRSDIKMMITIAEVTARANQIAATY